MKTLTKAQRKILKNIPNKKSRSEQKTQFKLQNAHDREIVFVNGKFKTDSKKLQKFLNNRQFFGEGVGDETSTIVQLDLTDFNKKIDEIESKGLFDKKIINKVNKKYFNLTEFLQKTLKNLPDFLKENPSNFVVFKNGIYEKKITETTDAPKEFCVEITKENKEVLQRLKNIYHKIASDFPITPRGKFLVSNSLFSYFFYTEENYIEIEGFGKKELPIVSTEEFLTYIGREDLIKYDAGKVITNQDEAGHWKQVTDNPYKLWNDVVPKKISDFTQTILPKDNDYVVEPNIFDRQQKLFNYLSTECSFTALQSQMQDIEDIVKGMIKPTETVEPKTYTLEDMEECFNASMADYKLNYIYFNFKHYLDSLK